MSGKREINGVFMIPFGLVAGFADGQEIRYAYGAHGREEETSTARSRKAGHWMRSAK